MNTEREYSLLKNALANRVIYSITKFTTLDYPNHLACILWFAKCNMACPYCYNPDIVRGDGVLSIGEILDFLQKRVGMLDGVVLSGGECTLCPDVEYICEKIKNLGFKIKIDTNGSNPKTLETLIEKDLIDYVALDYKAPNYKFQNITKRKDFDKFSQTLDLLIAKAVPFEARTTVHSKLLDENDINAIIEDLHKRGYGGVYYLQNYLHVGDTLGKTVEQDNKLNVTKLSQLIPIELRNF
ncbi:MAG: anaerobic ribonucleoside-triphosphate reductase activating protein [Sulfurospirillaceae bacterium]|nr:anaerobic ribonucleoside-triphosphate reductase activating protein [Sulfurospirillaceae bacterium]